MVSLGERWLELEHDIGPASIVVGFPFVLHELSLNIHMDYQDFSSYLLTTNIIQLCNSIKKIIVSYYGTRTPRLAMSGLMSNDSGGIE